MAGLSASSRRDDVSLSGSSLSAPMETPFLLGASCLALELNANTTNIMNALVGYGSSDEEEEDTLPQRPAKVGLC
jgi:hypothetical protein